MGRTHPEKDSRIEGPVSRGKTHHRGASVRGGLTLRRTHSRSKKTV